MSIAKMLQKLAVIATTSLAVGCMQAGGPFVRESSPAETVQEVQSGSDEVAETNSEIELIDYDTVEPGNETIQTTSDIYYGPSVSTNYASPVVTSSTQNMMTGPSQNMMAGAPGQYVDGGQIVGGGQVIGGYDPMMTFSGATTTVLTSPRNAHVSAISGARLGLYAGQTATERAIALKLELDEERAKTAQLEAQVAQLTQNVNEKDAQIRQATIEIENASTELLSVRTELESWKTEVERIQSNVLRAEQMNRETLDFIIRQLRELIEHTAPATEDKDQDKKEGEEGTQP